jgi:hypothetical protein
MLSVRTRAAASTCAGTARYLDLLVFRAPTACRPLGPTLLLLLTLRLPPPTRARNACLTLPFSRLLPALTPTCVQAPVLLGALWRRFRFRRPH